MGCLWSQKKKYFEVKPYQQNKEDGNKDNQSIMKKQSPKGQQAIEISNRQMGYQGLNLNEISCLLTNSSIDDQEVIQIDNDIKLRRNYLMKRKHFNYARPFSSYKDPHKAYNQIQKIKRTYSLGQITNKNVSINMFYYEKFKNMNKEQKKPEKKQIDSIILCQEENKVDDPEIEEGAISQNSSFSSVKQLLVQCQYCKKDIQNDQYQLECFHIYDNQCLIQQDQTQINCLCRQIIKTKLVRQILQNNHNESQQYLERLFINQQQKLKLQIQ